MTGGHLAEANLNKPPAQMSMLYLLSSPYHPIFNLDDIQTTRREGALLTLPRKLGKLSLCGCWSPLPLALRTSNKKLVALRQLLASRTGAGAPTTTMYGPFSVRFTVWELLDRIQKVMPITSERVSFLLAGTATRSSLLAFLGLGGRGHRDTLLALS